METELQSALDQEGYESDTLELDATNSMATKVGSRARYPSITTAHGTRKQSQLSCTSTCSIGVSNVNSTTALLPHTISESSVGDSRFVDSSGSNSEEDCTCRIQDCHTTCNHEYYNFTPDEYEECQCCHGNSVASLDNSRHILNSSSNSNDRSVTPPSVPIFEMFYNDSSNPNQPQAAAARVNYQQHSKPPSSLKFRDRDRLPSQSSCGTELTVLPDTPLGSSLYKSMEGEPADYSLPIRTTPIPPHVMAGDDISVPRPVERKGGPLNVSSRSYSSSSSSQHPPSTRSSTSTSSTGHYDKAATTTVTSPLNHFYFTLDPNSSSIHSPPPPAVFDSDSETPKHGHKTSRFNSTSSADATAYHGYNRSLSRYSDYNHNGSDPRDRGYNGYSPSVGSDRLSCAEDELAGTSIDGSSSMHRHMLQEHSGQRFECEYSH